MEKIKSPLSLRFSLNQNNPTRADAVGPECESDSARAETEERNIAVLAIRDNQFAYPAFNTSTYQRMIRRDIHGAADGGRCIDGRAGVMLRKKRKYPFKIVERVLRIDYPRHGLGRVAFGLWARRSIQACTFSAE